MACLTNAMDWPSGDHESGGDGGPGGGSASPDGTELERRLKDEKRGEHPERDQGKTTERRPNERHR